MREVVLLDTYAYPDSLNGRVTVHISSEPVKPNIDGTRNDRKVQWRSNCDEVVFSAGSSEVPDTSDLLMSFNGYSIN